MTQKFSIFTPPCFNAHPNLPVYNVLYDNNFNLHATPTFSICHARRCSTVHSLSQASGSLTKTKFRLHPCISILYIRRVVKFKIPLQLKNNNLLYQSECITWLSSMAVMATGHLKVNAYNGSVPVQYTGTDPAICFFVHRMNTADLVVLLQTTTWHLQRFVPRTGIPASSLTYLAEACMCQLGLDTNDSLVSL